MSNKNYNFGSVSAPKADWEALLISLKTVASLYDALSDEAMSKGRLNRAAHFTGEAEFTREFIKKVTEELNGEDNGE